VTPAVSIVVPCYNGGRFLGQMLASLDAQTFRDFETIIVDDGSTDPDTVTALGALPPAIKVVRQENQGLAAARNTGFRAASADIVLPLDCDDALAPSFLADAVQILNSSSPRVGFVFSDMQATGSLGGVLPRSLSRFDQLFLNRLPYALLLRKSAWQSAGGYDATMRDGYEDWEFNIRLVLGGWEGVRIARPLFRYYVSAEGMLMSRSARQHGRLWRRIITRHPDVYALAPLRKLRAVWHDPNTRFGPWSGLALVWLGRMLPERLVGAIFFQALRATHWYRVRRGILTSPVAAATKQEGGQ
jgi:glycosyltransferase involved in cell wall biosynthesis